MIYLDDRAAKLLKKEETLLLRDVYSGGLFLFTRRYDLEVMSSLTFLEKVTSTIDWHLVLVKYPTQVSFSLLNEDYHSVNSLPVETLKVDLTVQENGDMLSAHVFNQVHITYVSSTSGDELKLTTVRDPANVPYKKKTITFEQTLTSS